MQVRQLSSQAAIVIIKSLMPQLPELLTKLLMILMVKVDAVCGTVNDTATTRSLKLVLMESVTGVGLPQKSVVPPLAAVKVYSCAVTPSTMKKMVLLTHESIL